MVERAERAARTKAVLGHRAGEDDDVSDVDARSVRARRHLEREVTRAHGWRDERGKQPASPDGAHREGLLLVADFVGDVDERCGLSWHRGGEEGGDTRYPEP